MPKNIDVETNEEDVGDLGKLLKPHFKTFVMTKEEMDLGEMYGQKMWKINKAAGRIDERSSEEAEIAWIRSEIVVAKWQKLPYGDPCNKFTRVPDVNFSDVKWTADMEHGVPIRKNQPNNRAVISAAGIAPLITLRGWEFSQHIKKWGQDTALKTKKPMFDLDGKMIFPWRQLKPMYLLSRDPGDYQICFGCPGNGVTEKNEPCQDCILGQALAEKPLAFKQMLRALSFQTAA